MSIARAALHYFERINVEAELQFSPTDRLSRFQSYLENLDFPRVFPSSFLSHLSDTCLWKMSRLFLSDSVQPIAQFEFEFGTEAHQAEVDRLSHMLIDHPGICSQQTPDPLLPTDTRLLNLFGQLQIQQRKMASEIKEISAKQVTDSAAIKDELKEISAKQVTDSAELKEISAKQVADSAAIKDELKEISAKQVTDSAELKGISAKQVSFVVTMKDFSQKQDAMDASLRSMQVAVKSTQSIPTPRASTQYFEQFFNSIDDDNEHFDQMAFKKVDFDVSKIWKQFCTNLLGFDRDVRVYNQEQTEPFLMPFKTLLSKRDPRFQSEAECQAFMNVVLEILCDLLPDRTVDWRDTSMSTFAPSNPLYKFDASFVRKGSVSADQSCVVDWNDVIWFAEFKKKFTATLVKAGCTQIVDGVAELTSKQTYFSEGSAFGRNAGIAFLSDGVEVQFAEFIPGKSTMSMMRSKRMLLLPSKRFCAQDPVPTGFSLLVRFLMTNPRTLHYVDHGARKLEGAFASSEMNSKVRAHRIMHKGKPDVFFVTPVDQLAAPFVVKRYSNLTQFKHELAIYHLGGLTDEQKRHFPELLSSHISSQTIAIRPLAQSSIYENKFSIDLMKEVIRAGLQVLPLLHGRGLIHGDISSGNILVCDRDAAGQCRVVINDFSHTLKLGFSTDRYFGTQIYSSLRMDKVVLMSEEFNYGPIDDWQSFAIVLLEFCLARTSSSELVARLPWAASHLLECDVFTQKRLNLTDSAILGKLLSASTCCLDQSGLEFMHELIATLFQSTDFDEQRRVAKAISLLNLFVKQEPSAEVINSSQIVYVLPTGKRFHTRSICQGIIFQPIAFAEKKNRTKCQRCAQADAKPQVDAVCAVASMPELELEINEPELDPETGFYVETDEI